MTQNDSPQAEVAGLQPATICHSMANIRKRLRPSIAASDKQPASKPSKPRSRHLWKSDPAVNTIQTRFSKPLPPLPTELEHVVSSSSTVSAPRTDKPYPPRPGHLVIQRAGTVKLKQLGDRRKLTTDLPPLQPGNRTFYLFSNPPSPLGLFSVFSKTPNLLWIKETIWTLALEHDKPFVVHGYRGGGNVAIDLQGNSDMRHLRALSEVNRTVRFETNMLFWRVNRFIIWHDGDARLKRCSADQVLASFQRVIGENAFSRITDLGFGAAVPLDVGNYVLDQVKTDAAGRELAMTLLNTFRSVALAAKQNCYSEQNLHLDIETIVTLCAKQLRVKERFDLNRDVSQWRSDTVERYVLESIGEAEKGNEVGASIYAIMAIAMRETRECLSALLPVHSLV